MHKYAFLCRHMHYMCKICIKVYCKHAIICKIRYAEICRNMQKYAVPNMKEICPNMKIYMHTLHSKPKNMRKYAFICICMFYMLEYV